MGISMSQSEEIHRLERLDEMYHNRNIQKLTRSAPTQFRDHQNQQFTFPAEKNRMKHLSTEPPQAALIVYPPQITHRTVEYQLEADLEEFDLRGQAMRRSPEKSKRIKENINKTETLRVTKSNAENEVLPNPQSMRSRKVKASRK